MKKNLIILAMFIVSLAGCKNGNWYDYGNGKINLDKVNYINAKINATLSLPSDDIDTIGHEFIEPLTTENVQKYKDYLNPEKVKNLEFYRIHLKTFILFDNFTLTLKESETYTKLPETYQINDYMLKVWAEKGANESMIENFNKNKGKKYNQDQFINLLKESGANIESEWVKSWGLSAGLGESGSKFYQLYSKTKEIKPVDEIQLNLLKSYLDESINQYNKLPLGNQFF